MDNISKRLRNFIIFSYLKQFVDELSEYYDEDDCLLAYKNFMNQIDVLEEAGEFVSNFECALNGKHKAKYCDGAYVHIPKILSYKDKHYDIILKSLDKLKKIYVDLDKCKEVLFIKNSFSNILNKQLPLPSDSLDSEEQKKYFKDVLMKIKPDVDKTHKEFIQQELNIDRFLKILVIGIYDKLDYVFKDPDPNEKEDLQSLENIVKILVNTPINKLLTSKKGEIIKQVTRIKNFSNIPFKNILDFF